MLAAGSQIAKHVKPGTECVLYGRVSDINGKPLANATVSVWQTSADGLYDIQENASIEDLLAVQARIAVERGLGAFQPYIDGDTLPRPPHGF